MLPPQNTQIQYSVQHSAKLSVTRFVVSVYLPWFHKAKRYARLHLPYSGSLGSRFPTFPVRGYCLDHR